MFEYQFLLTILHALGFTIEPTSQSEHRGYVTIHKGKSLINLTRQAKVIPSTFAQFRYHNKFIRAHDFLNIEQTMLSLIMLLAYEVKPTSQNMKYDMNEIVDLCKKYHFWNNPIGNTPNYDLIITNEGLLFNLVMYPEMCYGYVSSHSSDAMQSVQEAEKFIVAANCVRDAILMVYKLGR